MGNIDFVPLADALVVDALKTQFQEKVWIEYMGQEAKLFAEACAARVNALGAELKLVEIGSAHIAHVTKGEKSLEAFTEIFLTFQNGRVVSARAENDERSVTLNSILDKDAGARYVGEFAIAFNPAVEKPMGNILFDEKIKGSLHLALGQCYSGASNGKDSAVHWDMVHIQRPEYGGGTIEIDGRVIRRDGRFIAPELQGLNPENLL